MSKKKNNKKKTRAEPKGTAWLVSDEAYHTLCCANNGHGAFGQGHNGLIDHANQLQRGSLISTKRRKITTSHEVTACGTEQQDPNTGR